mmetsp:Transcript_1889/g.3772  ORF Transcript_1889/g.3772 Transcript_1889/m.3772 type:complete len:364 (+) Transcript_1889:12-1103(+)
MTLSTTIFILSILSLVTSYNIPHVYAPIRRGSRIYRTIYQTSASSMFNKGQINPSKQTITNSFSTSLNTANVEISDEGKTNDKNQQKKEERPKIYPPADLDDMIRQVTAVVNRSPSTRQIIRTPLPRSSSSKDLGRLYEAQSSSYDTVLVPSDETWQGGCMQLYRAAVPVSTSVLRGVTRNPLPPKVTESRECDDSGVDGVGYLVTSCVDPNDDASCFVQPTQETFEYIKSAHEVAKDRVVILHNPQWRDVDDALDTASKGKGFFGGVASFLGGKGATLKKLDELGFNLTYCFDGYVCKGGSVWLLKHFDTSWHVFAENDDGDDYIFLGTKDTRPSYQDVDGMMDRKGIAVKYARDIGIAPKL